MSPPGWHEPKPAPVRGGAGPPRPGTELKNGPDTPTDWDPRPASVPQPSLGGLLSYTDSLFVLSWTVYCHPDEAVQQQPVAEYAQTCAVCIHTLKFFSLPKRL